MKIVSTVIKAKRSAADHFIEHPDSQEFIDQAGLFSTSVTSL
jgi:hypothetical protein